MPPEVSPLDREDPTVTTARAAELEAYAVYGLEPRDHLVEIPELSCTIYEVGVGHLPWLDEPHECGELVRGFLQSDS